VGDRLASAESAVVSSLEGAVAVPFFLREGGGGGGALGCCDCLCSLDFFLPKIRLIFCGLLGLCDVRCVLVAVCWLGQLDVCV
jgi:hypothetical protein